MASTKGRNPPWQETVSWFILFWHILDRAPHADFRKSPDFECLFNALTTTLAPQLSAMMSLIATLLKAKLHSKSQPASWTSILSTWEIIMARIISIPSLAMICLFGSSLDMIARIPKQVFIVSDCNLLSSILRRMSFTLWWGYDMTSTVDQETRSVTSRLASCRWLTLRIPRYLTVIGVIDLPLPKRFAHCCAACRSCELYAVGCELLAVSCHLWPKCCAVFSELWYRELWAVRASSCETGSYSYSLRTRTRTARKLETT